MIVNYYARHQNVIDPVTGNIFQSDPKKLNEWLQQNNGYYSGARPLPPEDPTYWDTAFLDLKAVVKYAKINGVNLSADQTLRPKNSENSSQFISRTKDTLDESMCALNPAILGINSNGHFIDSTGKLVEDGVDTWQIHDPLWNGNPPGLSTLKAKYSNTYNQIDLMSGNLPKKHLTFTKYSPVEMYITDPEGKKAGFDPTTNTFYEEIPFASYGTKYLGADDGGGGLIEAGMLDIPDPVDGEYTLTVVGTGNGEYGLEARESDDKTNITSNSIFATTTVNQTSTYLIEFSLDPETPVVIQEKAQIKIIPNKVYPNAGILAVVIMGEADLDVKDINISSLRFGNGEAKALQNKGFFVDINSDSKKDLLLFFSTKQVNIGLNDTQICLTGNTKAELHFKGCDEITVTSQIPTLLQILLNILGSVEPQELLKIRQFLNVIK